MITLELINADGSTHAVNQQFATADSAHRWAIDAGHRDFEHARHFDVPRLLKGYVVTTK